MTTTKRHPRKARTIVLDPGQLTFADLPLGQLSVDDVLRQMTWELLSSSH